MSGYGPMIAENMGNVARSAQERANFLADEQRQAQLQTIAGAGLSPEQQAEAIRTLYAKDPSALKRHVQNLFGRLTGKAPQPTPDAYPAQLPPGPAPQVGEPVQVGLPAARTQAERLAQILSGAPAPQQKDPLQLFTAEGEVQNRQAAEKVQQQQKAVFALIDKYITDPEQNRSLKEDYVRKQAGVMSAFKPIPGQAGQPYKDPATGKIVRPVQNADGTIGTQEMPAGYQLPTPKQVSPGAQYMHALIKKNSGQPLTPDEEAALKSYPEYVRQTSVIPGVARAAAFGANRPMVVVNPNNPQQTMVVTASQAERGGLATPQSISYQLDAAGQKAMIPRNLGQNLAALSTAEDHLQMLGGMVDALGNGDVPLLNSLGLRWAQATGDPAPINFDTLKTSLEGEMARAYTGVGATNQETAMIGETISRANSPEQLRGALATAHEAMAFRKKNLWAQVNQAKSVPFVPSNSGEAPKHASPAPRASARKPWYKQSWAKAHPGEDANAAAAAARAAGREVIE